MIAGATGGRKAIPPLVIAPDFVTVPGIMRRVVSCYVLLLTVGYTDYLIGYEMRFVSIYLLIVAVAAWNLRRGALAIYALITVTVWILANWYSGLHYTRTWLVYWNMGNKLASVAISAVTVSMIKATLDEQRRLIRELRILTLDTRQLRELIPVCRICAQPRMEAEYVATLNEYLRETHDAQGVGGVCSSCLHERIQRVANIQAQSYFPAAEG